MKIKIPKIGDIFEVDCDRSKVFNIINNLVYLQQDQNSFTVTTQSYFENLLINSMRFIKNEM